MATVADLIDGSLRLIHQIGSGETASADEYADGLEAVNAILATWNNEIGMCYALREESLTFTAAVSRTLGPTGNLATTRPVEIVQAWVVDSNTSYPVRIISDEEYAAIPDKTTTGDWPELLNYKPDMPNGTVYFYPVPNASGTMKLLTRTPVSNFAATSDTISLPPGWERALRFNLAVDLASEFEADVPLKVEQIARSSKRALARMNQRPHEAHSDLPRLLGRGRSNILADR